MLAANSYLPLKRFESLRQALSGEQGADILSSRLIWLASKS